MMAKVVRKNSGLFMVALVSLLAASSCTVQAAKNYFPSFADEHTVGLWLFDETWYPYTTLTDAGANEYDLRLMKGARLVQGRYGNCLKVTPGLDYAASYAAWKGAVGFYHLREMSGKPGSGLFGPTVAPEKILQTLAKKDFTCEFWLRLQSKPTYDVVVIDLGDKFEPGFTVTVKANVAALEIENAYAGFKAACPTVLDQLWGRQWHHVAFTRSGRRVNYFIDGVLQEKPEVSEIQKSPVVPLVWPESIADTTYGIFDKENRGDKPDYDKRIRNRFNFAVGHDRHGDKDLDACVDELRFSDVVRYSGDFPLPQSFSRNYGPNAPKPAVPNGEPLLFGEDDSLYEPVKLGSRKHVFIDEVMVSRKRNVKLTLNRPTSPVKCTERAAWDGPFFEHEGKIYTVWSEGYEGDEAPIYLFASKDGVNFEWPNLGLIEYKGSKKNNLIYLRLPSWGRWWKDNNPNIHPEEQFKATLWVGQRGIYLYLSPDGIHWRRNETCMLPLVSGGGCATFWDDQRGVYVNFLKRDGSYGTGEHPAYGRGSTRFETREVTRPWPFNPVPNPYFEGWPYPAVTGEGLTVFGPDLFGPDNGQVFRTRPQKYKWAPDAYLAFLIRNGGSDMATSRDGIHWKVCSEEGLGYYQKGGGTFEGRPIGDAVVCNGMIKRGDKIWQYVNYGGAAHATVRMVQRLDGFCSLDAADEPGVTITRPLVFEGGTLTVNAAVEGQMKVAILSLPGKEITGYNVGLKDAPKKDVAGYGIGDCDPIKTDSVRHVVTWRGNSSVGNLAGQVVRLRFEMQNAKLYAFQFE